MTSLRGSMTKQSALKGMLRLRHSVRNDAFIDRFSPQVSMPTFYESSVPVRPILFKAKSIQLERSENHEFPKKELTQMNKILVPSNLLTLHFIPVRTYSSAGLLNTDIRKIVSTSGWPPHLPVVDMQLFEIGLVEMKGLQFHQRLNNKP